MWRREYQGNNTVMVLHGRGRVEKTGDHSQADQVRVRKERKGKLTMNPPVEIVTGYCTSASTLIPLVVGVFLILWVVGLVRTVLK